MQKLSLTKRPANIGAGIPTRTERHGNDQVGALTIPLKNILLFEKDVIQMYNDPDAHSRLFTGSRSAALEPAFPNTVLHITDKFKGAKVTLKADTMEEALILKPATIENIQLVCEDAGGHIIMSCTIKGAPADDVRVDILKMLNRKCTIAILNGSVTAKGAAEVEEENQGELPLDEGGPGPDEGSDDGQTTAVDREEAAATESATGRKIRQSEAKAKRASKKK
jgi:hypothetical protein